MCRQGDSIYTDRERGIAMDKNSLAVVRQQFAQTVFTHKIQEIAADRKYKYAKWFGFGQLILTIVVIAILAAQAMGYNNNFVNIVGIVSAAVDTAFLIIDLTYGFEKQAANHKSYALKYLDLRIKYQSLIADIASTKGRSKANDARRDALDDAYQMLTDTPQTTRGDYVKTQKALNTFGAKGGEQFTWADKEIDQFLPSQLRLLAKTKKTKEVITR